MKNLKHIPTYGDLFTLKEFITLCKSGLFTDYDGHGGFATKDEIEHNRFVPSEILQKRVKVPDWATHVVWFNK